MKNRFDEAATTWDAKPERMQMASKFAGVVGEVIKNKGYNTALEYGCGTANVSFCLKDYFKSIIASDAAQGMIDEVNKKLLVSDIKNIIPVVLDLENISFPEKFDVIYTLMAMHHVNNVEHVIAEFSKMLNKEGMLIIGDLEDEDGDFHPYPENQDVHFGFERTYLENILIKHGLKIIEFQTFHQMERTHTGTSKVYNLFSLSAVKNK